MDANRPGEPGGEGEYKVQTGFGWSNGVVLQLLSQYGWHPELLQVQRPWQIRVSCSCSPRSFPEGGKRATATSGDESLAPVHTFEMQHKIQAKCDVLLHRGTSKKAGQRIMKAAVSTCKSAASEILSSNH